MKDPINFEVDNQFTGNIEPFTAEYYGTNPTGLERLRQCLPLSWALNQTWGKWCDADRELANRMTEGVQKSAELNRKLMDQTVQRIDLLGAILHRALDDFELFNSNSESAQRTVNALKYFEVDEPDEYSKPWLIDVFFQVLNVLQKDLRLHTRSYNRNILRYSEQKMSLQISEHLRYEAEKILSEGMSFTIDDEEAKHAEKLTLHLKLLIEDPIENAWPEPDFYKLVDIRVIPTESNN